MTHPRDRISDADLPIVSRVDMGGARLPSGAYVVTMQFYVDDLEKGNVQIAGPVFPASDAYAWGEAAAGQIDGVRKRKGGDYSQVEFARWQIPKHIDKVSAGETTVFARLGFIAEAGEAAMIVAARALAGTASAQSVTSTNEGARREAHAAEAPL